MGPAMLPPLSQLFVSLLRHRAPRKACL